MPLHRIAADLTLLELTPPLPGFQHFMGAWVYHPAGAWLIDPGPASTIPQLLQMLAELGIERLEGILLTHIHLDHAGGVGRFLNAFGPVPVWCHPKGIPHLIAPEKLWRGSLQTLGPVAEGYGPLTPTPAELLNDATQVSRAGFQGICTPGHAAHHVSFLCGPYLMIGEAAGVGFRVNSSHWYHRPATPPPFQVQIYRASLDQLADISCERVCLGHFGALDVPLADHLDRHHRQLALWERSVTAALEHASDQLPVDRCIQILLANDPLLAAWSALPPDIQGREYGFLSNSVKGILSALQPLANQA